jgi:hypothetical protein
MRRAEAYSSGFQVMLTMVSIDATEGSERGVVEVVVAGEGNSSGRSWSAKDACAKSREGGIGISASQVFTPPLQLT